MQGDTRESEVTPDRVGDAQRRGDGGGGAWGGLIWGHLGAETGETSPERTSHLSS